jgi:fibronectin-binding autotransporter adhesin
MMPSTGVEVKMKNIRVSLWILMGMCCLAVFALASVNPAAGNNLPPTSTPPPQISPQAQALALTTGLEPSLVNEMLAGGIPAEDINQETALEWPAHLELLSQRQLQRQQAQPAGELDITSLEMSLPRRETRAPTAQELLWQQIEAAKAKGDVQTQLSLAGQLSDPAARQRLTDELTENQTASIAAPEAGEFIGRNGNSCAYNSWAAALAAAVDDDTLYVDQGTWVGRIGDITKDLTIIAAKNNCQESASSGVTIDGDDTSASSGGVADIGPSANVTFTNMILTNGSANNGGILYVSSSNVVLDNTDLTFGSASSHGGCLRINGGAVTLVNDSEITDCETTGSGDGGGAAMLGGTLNLYDASRIGDYTHGNYSAASGGGVYMLGGDLNMFDYSRIRSNTAYDYGGGVFANGGATINMYDSADIGYVFSTANNSAADGAGVYLDGSGDLLNMEDNSTLQFNTAAGFGGGVYLNTGSHLHMNSASILDNEAATRGGGMYTLDEVTVEMDNGSSISENEVTDGGGIGGGIYAWGENATFTVTNSSIVTNTAAHYGGIRLFGSANTSQITLQSNSELSYNTSTTGDGGGAGVYHANLTLDGSSASYNTSPTNGGAINLWYATLNLVDSRVERNEAGQNGGGIYNLSGEINITCQNDVGTVSRNNATNGSGGGIYDRSSNTLTIQGINPGACYVGSNYAGQNGGGVFIDNITNLHSEGAVIYVSNSAHDNGGAVFLNFFSSAIFNDLDGKNNVSTLYNNHASHGNGGAIFASDNSHVTMLGARVGTITGNIAYLGDGGGIYIANSDLTMINSRVLNNQAQLNGGGIAAYTSTVTIDSQFDAGITSRTNALLALAANPCAPGDLPINWYCSELKNNQVEGDGGGLYLFDSTSSINHTALLTNTADMGAAIRVYYGSLELQDSLIAANEANHAYNPAIIHVYAGTSGMETAVLTATHNTIADNLGSGIFYAAYTGGEFNNNIVWGNDTLGTTGAGATAMCNDTQDSVLSGVGNISSHPAFITTPRGDYRLSFFSPAVNRCTANGLEDDLDGVTRPWGAAYDMGAFEAIMTFLPVIIH